MKSNFIKKKKMVDEVTGVLFTIAPVLGIIIFTFVPLIIAFMMSFMEVNLGFQDAKLYPINEIFNNYVTVLKDVYFWKALKNNIVLFCELPISIIISIVIAELLSKKVYLHLISLYTCQFSVEYFQLLPYGGQYSSEICLHFCFQRILCIEQ
jgi:ABC-type sugar transport system permease subunit